MSEKDLKINFRYLTGNIACMSVDSVSGKSVHNDIDNEEAIILFNSLVGEKEGCRTVKTLLQENQQLKEIIEEIRELLKQGITFCENDSQGAYDVCNIAINREKKALEILDKAKGSDKQ